MFAHLVESPPAVPTTGLCSGGRHQQILNAIFAVYKILGVDSFAEERLQGMWWRGCWVCNRSTVVLFLGAIGLSPHSRLRRQCGVIHNVTARAVKIAGKSDV